ncbi:thiazole biosynthesis adenylyltransferase ThiF [Protomyces lactucae-debilis]|uniref:Thiazole biosynthesis adenylyltransferase ThiF n=1 Tax=Protomyces lactucae-debilis TaxID=2754530 RepID=A0A1Y2FET9_PROLT|nr:thiazole biosynthesis adenylyltransferase ThiF [Protomyces lactucae-debilis]ORY82470.1 thiazole biosynthesis adenylyltransferase ThiF [Protomyces lactucae-debilis]
MASLDLEEYRRYGRQMLLPEIGKPGQLSLKSSSVLIVGAGGLGCPCVAYLAGAGVGHLGVVDADTIDISNCHRQILHKPSDAGTSKVDSIASFVKELNAQIHFTGYKERLVATNVMSVLAPFDLILDCTDNQQTRYLISDACVLLDKPLVSGSALKMDGQLAVYNHQGGPCYRCIFPSPSPAASVQSCGEAGVLGPVVGIIGVMQALEAIKILIKIPLHRPSKLLLFSAYGEPQWRQITLRGKKPSCAVCGEKPYITKESIVQDTTGQYEISCSLDAAPLQVSKGEHRINALEAKNAMHTFHIIDVRDPTQFGIASLPGSKNVPLDDLTSYQHDCPVDKTSLVYAVMNLKAKYGAHEFVDMIGGLEAYSNIDKTFPCY